MRKANKSCMVSVAHTLIKRSSNRLFRFSSFHYGTKGVIFIDQPPLRSDRRYPGRHSPLRWSTVCPVVREQCFAMSSLRARHANCSVVGCINQHKCLYSVPATEEQKRQWLRFIFNDNAPAILPVSLYVCANHFTSDCFSNEGQYKALPRHWSS